MTTTTQTTAEVRRPTSLAEAVSELAGGGVPLAGGTWVMRASLRGAALSETYVSLTGVPELHGIEITADGVSIGAGVTHAELAASDVPTALRVAAARSAFPAIRSVATVGGNLAAAGFPEADLVPALLALGARVQLAGGSEQSVAEYLHTRGGLITRVVVPAPASTRSAFERLTIRGGGEYAVASVAICVTLDDGMVSDARVAVGVVEEIARLCPEAAATLVGGPLQADIGQRAGRVAAKECTGRDGLDAPGWYRLAVLPGLLRTAVARLTEEES